MATVAPVLAVGVELYVGKMVSVTLPDKVLSEVRMVTAGVFAVPMVATLPMLGSDVSEYAKCSEHWSAVAPPAPVTKEAAKVYV